MKKPLKITLIILGILFVLYHLLGWTGIFMVYNNPTIANEPNIKLGSKMFASNIAEPKNGNFICYRYQDEMLGEHIRVHRLCGMENDIVEIKNGTLFINGNNADKGIDYIHYYNLTTDEFNKIKESEKITENSNILRINENKIMVLLEDSFAKLNGFTGKRMIEGKDKIDKSINGIFNANWNKDNFGPLTIPQGKIFVIGDNRDNSEDSRWIGLIDKSNIVGVIIK